MSRDAQYDIIAFSTVAASAGTTYAFASVHAPFVMEGFEWWYGAADGIAQATGLTAEANTDNTFKFAIASAIDGTTFTDWVANFTNAGGLLDTAAPGVPKRNISNPSSGGAAFGAETVVTAKRLAANTLVRVQFVTAGTGTVPPQSIRVYGKFLASDGVT